MLGGVSSAPTENISRLASRIPCAFWSTTDGKMSREAKLKTSEGWAVSPGAHYLLGPRDADEEGTRSVFRLSTPSPTRKSRELLLTGCEPPPLATTGGHLRSDRILRELWQIIGHGSDTVRIAIGPEEDAIAFSAAPGRHDHKTGSRCRR
jgi:hypothetical protein